MKLKYLELYGFKSFSEKIRLQFDDDFVAVVGPNGSGKSNISDAIRWVLGEQSAKALRGDKMEDVIFSGTSKRPAMNVCKVTIGFDNSSGDVALPYQEIAVSRKVYRTGESEYRINGSLVRRKDVRELFFDTGVGKEGYSVIGQGRIDEILSSRNEDRRAVFEEAAGISKYKYQKMEAQRRLEKTQASLVAVQADFSLKHREQVLLKKQADNARSGYKLTQELERHELSLLQKQLNNLEEKKTRAEAEVQLLEAEQKEQTRDRDAAEAAMAPKQAQIAAFETQEEEAAQRLAQLEKKQAEDEKQFSVRLEQLRFYEQDRKRLSEEATQRQTRTEKLTQALSEGLQQKKEAEETLAALEAELRVKRALMPANPTASPDESYEALQRSAEQLSERIHFLEYEKKEKTESDASLAREQQEGRTRLDAGRKEIQAKKISLQALEEEGRTLSEQIRILQKDAEAAQEEVLRRGNEQEEKRRARSSIEQTLAALHSRVQILSNVIENYEGYFRPVQRLLKAADDNPSLRARFIGVLADLIQVKSPYETAIDVCLGAALQNVVVENEEDAKFLIQFLKDKNYGRCTFLPRHRIRGTVQRTHAPEALCNAMDAVAYDSSLQGIVEYLLGRTTIVSTIDDAIRLSRRNADKNRIVSLEGDLIHAWGSMVGGSLSKRNTGSLLNRKQQLQEWQSEGRRLQDELEKIRQDMAALERAIDAAKAREVAAGKERTDKEAQRLSIQARYLQEKADLERLEEKERELETMLAREQSFSEADYIARKNELTKNLEEVRAALAAAETQRQADEDQRQKLAQACAVLENRVEFQRRELQLIENRAADATDRLAALHEETERATQRSATLDRQCAENETWLSAYAQRKKEFLRQQEKAQQDVNALRTRRKEQLSEMEAQQQALEAARRACEESEKALFRERLRLEQAEEQRVNVLNTYLEQYATSEEEVAARLRVLEPVETTRTRVQEIKQALNQIGYFNFESIQAYDDLTKEVDFLDRQIEDLHRSQEDIEKLIQDLDHTMVARFQETFVRIREKYNEIFQILFNGGHAELALDQANVLEAGIEISAQPPGKKLQNLGLLSGGERSLTAMALLFAIFSIRPTPFCVLDEIDAALDEANIGRYAGYLQTLTKQTQFLVITHRRKTMEHAKMLYGVTMEEGMSKILVLRLDEYEAQRRKKKHS
uniref:chromosome segregation protein SMC n=1 Tax=Ndongobacter massiliensis TaxID=1871025 RepID=UPI0009300D2F|nr:chromosome segregation protein SMC [Ndongobacter massiliensis]